MAKKRYSFELRIDGVGRTPEEAWRRLCKELERDVRLYGVHVLTDIFDPEDMPLTYVVIEEVKKEENKDHAT